MKFSGLISQIRLDFKFNGGNLRADLGVLGRGCSTKMNSWLLQLGGTT